MYEVIIIGINGSEAVYRTNEPEGIAIVELVSFLQKNNHEGAVWSAWQRVDGAEFDITTVIAHAYARASLNP